MADELRAYFFQNMYLQGIHAGIQSQHTTAEMFLKYQEPCFKPEDDILYHWASHHKTTIILNGGYSENLIKIKSLLSRSDNPYPWAYFCESEEALNGAITNVGVILPDKVFNLKSRLSKETIQFGANPYECFHSGCFEDISEFDIELFMELNKCKLMT